ncbi:hypothetical protein GCM10009836_34010 [Pseudonocardia ailaonensis]|uniref:AMP-dependent ligase C-terminal domain-containing protein n=2 Tax=Pseudonocardia ailaonensis TaxID=367279 RepID=A0ABN2N7Z7_9PSEU
MPADGVTRIHLARPEKRNAQDPALLYQLDAALAAAAADPEVRVIVLAADGPDFSSGHDLAAPFRLPGPPTATMGGGFDAPGVEGHLAFECEAFLGLCRRWRELPKPTIAQVQGRVIAGGLMLVWPMDLVVAARDATFADPVAAFGVNGAEYFVHAFELGARRAKELLFTGEPIGADEARAMGMVNRVVEPGRLEEETLELARRIARRSPFGLRLAKTSVNRSSDAQGMQQAIDVAFALHNLGHANNLARFGSIVDPSGTEHVRDAGRSRLPAVHGNEHQRAQEVLVSVEVPYYWKALDWDAFMADYPPPPLFEQTVGLYGDEQIRELQDERLRARMRDAWQVPFYRKRWAAAGLDEGSVRSIEDLRHVPLFTSDDLKVAIDESPPFGDHHPFDRETMLNHLPLKLQTSGGTTGLPRPTMFDITAWEVQAVQAARAFWAMGARPGDVIQIPVTTSLSNGPWSVTTGLQHWLGAVPVTTGSGLVTPSERQLELASAYGTNGWHAFGEYLGRLAEVADAVGFDLHSLPTRYIQAMLGNDSTGELRRALEKAWGAPVYDIYGTHEIGMIAFECREQNGRHVSEDTVYLETVDVDDPSRPADPGGPGDLVATSLHRNVPPIIRFNTKDALAILPRDRCACGLVTTRLSGLTGRSDEMVKLRGQNVFPMACQDPVRADPRTNGQFLCVLHSAGTGLASRTEMTIRVERGSSEVDAGALRPDLEAALKNALGVRVDVEVVEAGELSPYTGLGGEGKIRRLLDLRGK